MRRAAASLPASRFETTPGEIAQAALEGVAYRLADVLDAIGGLESVVATGHALLANDAWLQILADVLGRAVEVSGAPEGSARGAALVAFERLGLAVPPAPSRACRRAAAGPPGDPFGRQGRTTEADAFTGGDMIGIVGGGLAAAKVVQSYREAGGTDDIVVWSQDPHGPYHRPPLTKRLLRGESDARGRADRSCEGVDLRLGERIESLDAVEADTIVLATGAHAAPARRRARLPHARRLARAPPPRRVGEDGDGDRRRLHRLRDHRVADDDRRAGDADRARPDAVRHDRLPAALRGAPRASYRAHGVDLRLEASDIPAADIVVAGIGVEPNVELARDAGLDVRSGIVVDERFRDLAATASMRSATSPSSSTRSTGVTAGSSTGRTPPTTGRRSARSSPATTARYDIVSSFFSEEFGRSFRSFGDASGHDVTSLEGDFAGDHAVYRFQQGGDRSPPCRSASTTRSRTR